MVEILVEKEKRERSNSEGGIHLPSFTTLAHDVPSFIPLPKGVISTNPASTYATGEEESPSNEGWGEEKPENNAAVFAKQTGFRRDQCADTAN